MKVRATITVIFLEFFCKIHGKKIGSHNNEHDLVISSHVKMRCVIKGLHCIIKVIHKQLPFFLHVVDELCSAYAQI